MQPLWVRLIKKLWSENPNSDKMNFLEWFDTNFPDCMPKKKYEILEGLFNNLG